MMMSSMAKNIYGNILVCLSAQKNVQRLGFLFVFILLVGARLAAANACIPTDASGAQEAKQDNSQIILRCEQRLDEIGKSDPSYASLSLALATLYQKTGDLGSAEAILKAVLEKTPPISNSEKIASLRQLGIVYFTQRQYDASFTMFEQALNLMIKLDDKEYMALGYNDLASVYQAYGDYDSAAKLLLLSYDLHTEVNNTIGRASALNNLGTLYREQGAFDEAIVSLRRSYTLYQTSNSTLRAAMTLANLGNTFLQSGDSIKAIDLLQEAATSLQSLNAYHLLAKVYVLLAEAKVASNAPDQAQEFLNQAKLSWNMLQAKADNPKYWFIQGNVFELKNELKQAEHAYQQAFQQVKQDNEFGFQIKLYEAMAKLNEKQQDFQSSSQYWQYYASTLEKQRTLKNSINSKKLRSTFSFKDENASVNWINSRAAIALFSAMLSIVILFFYTRIKNLLVKRKAATRKEPSTSSDTAIQTNDMFCFAKSAPLTSNTTNIGMTSSGATNIAMKSSTTAVKSEPPFNDIHDFCGISESNLVSPVFDSSSMSNVALNFAANDVEDTEKNSNALSQNDTNTYASSEKESDVYRQQLVEMMHLALQMWEEHTQTGKLELAEKSKIWSVGVDDGRLRARAMERYFSINTLPQKPRWRSVVRTCNYVLRHCCEKSLYREELEANVKSFQAVIKRKATIVSKCG